MIGNSVDKSFTCSKKIGTEQVTLNILKNPPSEQITGISFSIQQGKEVTKTIEYQPSVQSHGMRTDDLSSYFTKYVYCEGMRDYDYGTIPYDELNSKFIYYANQFVKKFDELKKMYTEKA